VYYCTVNKEKALHFYEDTTVSCISDTIFYFSLETVLAWRAVQFECGKPLLLVYCHVPYQHCALVSNRLKIYIYIMYIFVWMPTSEWSMYCNRCVINLECIHV